MHRTGIVTESRSDTSDFITSNRYEVAANTAGRHTRHGTHGGEDEDRRTQATQIS